MTDYSMKPGLDGWNYESLDSVRQVAIWWLLTHNSEQSTIYEGSKKCGVIFKDGEKWCWKPIGSRTREYISPASGEVIKSRRKKGGKRVQ